MTHLHEWSPWARTNPTDSYEMRECLRCQRPEWRRVTPIRRQRVQRGASDFMRGTESERIPAR